MISELLKTIPLPSLDTYSYSEAKVFSRDLDEKLGFEIERIEKEISEKSPNTPWAGLEPQVLQTPYSEIRLMLSKIELKAGQKVVDLGAAYGRMAFVIAHFFPESFFVGYEISPERVKEGQRVLGMLGFPGAELRCEDISRTEFKIPDADAYFLYDFGDLESIIRIIDQLKRISKTKAIRVIGRGRRTRDHIERHEPWLSQVNPPHHCGNFSIYFS